MRFSLLQIINRNHVSMQEGRAGTAGHAPPSAQPLVSHAAFSHDGACLVTVDVRPDAGEVLCARLAGSQKPSLISFPEPLIYFLIDSASPTTSAFRRVAPRAAA